ncbi:hypothetical protein PFISCL1PPCAC_20438, partial [Pristionchus fissidentatus]
GVVNDGRMSGVAEEDEAKERWREEELEDDEGSEEDDEETEGEEEVGRRESCAPSVSSLLSTPSRKGIVRERGVRSHALVELTSLDELALPSNAARSIKYTCVSASKRLLVLGTSTGSVYVFARYASKHRAKNGGGRLNAVPLHVYTTKDGALHTVRISPNEQLIAVGGESGRVSVLSLAAGVGAATAAGAASSAPSSPASALVHTVPGDARKSDRVNCVCWSSDSSVVYAAHSSGLVALHKIGTRRSVFRSAVDRLLQLEGPAIQIEYAAGPTDAATAARLLISTPEATFIHDLQAGKVYQVGKKPRNGPMGACWMRGDGSAIDDFVLAARQNGRLWEASGTGIVYKTHQLRQSSTIPTLDPLSFRAADAATATATTSLQQASIDTETARTTVHLGTLIPITVDCVSPPPPPPSSDPSLPSLPSTSVSTSIASTVSSSISKSTATTGESSGLTTRLVCSAVGSTLLVADVDRSQLIVVSDLGYVIRDYSVCGSDVFVLLGGGIGQGGTQGALRKFTLLPIETATERLLLKKAALLTARLVLSVRPSEDTVDSRDTVVGWSMPLIEKIQTALAALKKKESESLRRQLNDLVCGGDQRKASIEEDEITVVRESFSTLAVARTRRVSNSDRYLDKRLEDEERGGEESEYEDGEGRLIRRVRKKATDDDQRSRSSPDNSQPLNRATAAKKRTVSPRNEGRRRGREDREEREGRKEELKRAKKLLESESGLRTEHRDSLRTLLELGSPPPIDFQHSVTVASVARNLAELARVAPPSITDLLVERRASAKPSTASVRRGARVVKAIRPQRPMSGGMVAGGAVRSSGAAMGEEESNSNVVVIGSKKETRDEEDSENNVEWRKGKRMGGVFVREEGGALTRASVGQVEGAESAATAAITAAAEMKADRCERCGLHKSWLALFLFGTAVHRVNVVYDGYGRGGVPSTVDEWCNAVEEVIERREKEERKERREACTKCARTMQKALESVPSSGRFCDGLRQTGTRIDAEAMRTKVFSLPEDVLRATVFGVRTERRRRKETGGDKENEREREARRTQEVFVPSVTVTDAEGGGRVENGNGEERREKEKEKEEEDEDEGKEWRDIIHVGQLLTGALFAIGRDGLRDVITHRVKRSVLEGLRDGDWALIARLIAPRENGAVQKIPNQVARAMLVEYGMSRFVSIERPPTQPATVITSSMRGGGYGRRVSSVDSASSTKDATAASWPIDCAGVCPMCSLSLTTPVGGGRTTSAASESCSMLACYPCGHSYHAICIGEATKRRQTSAGSTGISPVCIVCRVRARRSRAAATAAK